MTNFTLSIIRCDKVWVGITFFPKDNIPVAIKALSPFTDNVENDKESNLDCTFTYMPDFKDDVIATLCT